MKQREIKFRAWYKLDKKMVELPYYFKGEHSYYGYMTVDGFVPDTDSLEFTHYNREDFEIMQWTGLTDKNGKEIYEGDVVYIFKDKFGPGQHEVWTVEYENAAFVVFNQFNSTRQIETIMDRVFFEPWVDEEYLLEVIGNIYENPELLK